MEHWTEAITQFFDGLGAWGAKQLISIAGRDCAIDWRAVIQRVICMGKPMGKPLCPYSGIVWLVKLNIEMWDDSWLFENLISHWRHISYFLIIVKMCSLKPRLPTAFKFKSTNVMDFSGGMWPAPRPDKPNHLVAITTRHGSGGPRTNSANPFHASVTWQEGVHSDIFNPNALLESNLKRLLSDVHFAFSVCNIEL